MVAYVFCESERDTLIGEQQYSEGLVGESDGLAAEVGECFVETEGDTRELVLTEVFCHGECVLGSRRLAPHLSYSESGRDTGETCAEEINKFFVSDRIGDREAVFLP